MTALRFKSLCAIWVAALLVQSAPASSKTLIITGSDTLAALLTSWSVAFSETHPDTVVEIQAAGSAAAPIALAEGTASLGAMSRRMSGSELERVVARQGHLPMAIPVARDALAIVVHPDNPVDRIPLSALDGIYSAGQLCGDQALRRWSEVGIGWPEGPPLEAYGRTSISGSYGFFKGLALCSGDYSSRVIELPGFAAIVDAVASSPGAIAYVSLGYVNRQVKILPLLLSDGSLTLPSTRNNSGPRQYPLARTLYLYTAVDVDGVAPTEVCEFLTFIQTSRAQSILLNEGFLPIDTAMAGRAGVSGGATDACQ